jgi:hypothetical protein
MEQLNIATGTTRKIRRVEAPRGATSMPTDEQTGEATA